MNKYLTIGLATASAFLSFGASASAFNLNQLTASQWDTYSGDNTRFDGIVWKTGTCRETVDERNSTPWEVAQVYNSLSNAIFGRRVTMTAGYAFDKSYRCGFGKWHAGIDMGASRGTVVKAAISGTTTMIQNKVGDYFLGIRGDDGNLWIYGHLGTLSVSTNGVRVNAGTNIGTIGSAAHLHLEVQNGHTYQKTYGASTDQNFILRVTASPLEAYFRATTIKNAGGKCLDVRGGSVFNNGIQTQIWNCNGTIAQEWRTVGDTIKNTAGRCLDIQGGNIFKDGTPVWLYQCNGTNAQKWNFNRSTGEIRNPVSNKCLDVRGGTIGNSGTPVQIWTCNRTNAQKWN